VSEPEASLRLVVGLGNPGPQYADTRHNAGFWLVDELARQHGGHFRPEAKYHGETCRIALAGQDLWLLKPMTFMNRSGQSVAALARFHRIPPAAILVAHDDLDLPLGTLRLRPGGGSGGQKGIASTIEQMGTADFPRMRMGIDRPPGQMDAAAYVLQSFNAKEQEFVAAVLDRAVKAVQVFIERGLETAMNQFNGAAKEG